MPSESKYVQNYLSGESINWTDGNAIGTPDSLCAFNSKGDGYGVYDFQGSLFNIPIGATIDGIEVTTRRAIGDSNDIYLIALHDGVDWREQAGTNPGVTTCAEATDETLGTSTDKWGGSWTASHINSANFKVRITHDAVLKGDTIYIDSVYVVVHYTSVSQYTKTFTADGALANRLEKDFVADGVLSGQEEKTITVDAPITNRLTKTFQDDSVLVNRLERQFASDGYLKLILDKKFTADSCLEKTLGKDFTTDTVLKKIQAQSFTTNGTTVNRHSKALVVDACLRALVEKNLITDSILVNRLTEAFMGDAVLVPGESGETKTFTADTYLIQTDTKALVIDAALKKTLERPFAVDAALRKTSAKNLSSDAILITQSEKTFTTDVALKIVSDPVFSVDAVLSGDIPTRTIIDIGPPMIRWEPPKRRETFTNYLYIEGTIYKRFVAEALAKVNIYRQFLEEGVLGVHIIKKFKESLIFQTPPSKIELLEEIEKLKREVKTLKEKS